MAEVYILDAARSAVGKSFKGSFTSTRSDDLSATVVAEILGRSPHLDPADVTDLYWGCSLPNHSQAYNFARQVGLLSGLPSTVPALTLSRSCGSAFSAIRMAAHAIAAGDGEVYIAGGADSFTMCLGKAFSAEDHNPRFVDPSRADFVNYAYMEVFDTAEIVAEAKGVGRVDMDEFAVLSHQRAVAAAKEGYFDAEIVPVRRADGVVVAADDSPRADTSLEQLGRLRAISPDRGGRVTAGNTCVAGDGAAALLLSSKESADRSGAVPKARILGSSVAGLAPEMMGMGPVPATEKLLARHGLTTNDIDIFEVHENFSAQVLPVCAELGIDIDRQLNPFGGAIAIGHPPGMTGARLVQTLVHGLEVRDQHLGLATACVAGGQGLSILVERTA
jgi:acetyl-CoA C-acetyltransferase